VSDKPEVHSGGYHIRFDTIKNKFLGLIKPEWIATGSSSGVRWPTEIVLPLSSSFVRRQHQGGGDMEEQIMSKLEELQGVTFLFMRKLRRIVVRNHTSGLSRVMSRRDIVPKTLIEIDSSFDQRDLLGEQLDAEAAAVESKGGKKKKGKESASSSLVNREQQRWLVTRQTLLKPPDRKEVRDIPGTDLCLAFPINPLGTTGGSDAKASEDADRAFPDQPVFAFLPVASYGFRFVVQGDFVLPSSRAEIDSDCAFNQVRSPNPLSPLLNKYLTALPYTSFFARACRRSLRRVFHSLSICLDRILRMGPPSSTILSSCLWRVI
jgi:hypothetical protein